MASEIPNRPMWLFWTPYP